MNPNIAVLYLLFLRYSLILERIEHPLFTIAHTFGLLNASAGLENVRHVSNFIRKYKQCPK